jgi:pimeloyl-ACP methyl ester carboxylesterase
MVEIIDQHDNWVEKNRRGCRGSSQNNSKKISKLKFWGYSYGSVIGQTFMTMYPHRVGRIVLDGIVDTEEYYNGPWLANILDADKVLDRFFHYCHQGGNQTCPFHSPGGPKAMKYTYQRILHDLMNSPLPVPGSSSRGPDVITWSDVVSLVRLGMYQPRQYFPQVAAQLAGLAQRNGSLFADLKFAQRARASCPSRSCLAAGPFSAECAALGNNEDDAGKAVLCADARGLGDTDVAGFVAYWDALRRQSAVLGDWWAHTRLGCVGWKAAARWRFDGPFGARTAHPALWLSNELDPITPLRNARRAAKRFPGSVLLEQAGEGHTTLGSPSLCTAKAVRRYFQTGQLPEKGTLCQVDEKPFIGRVDPGVMDSLSDESQKLARAWEMAGDKLAKLKTGMPGDL